MQRNPKAIHYNDYEHHYDMHLRVISDAAFKKEADDGCSMSGAMLLVCGGHPEKGFSNAKAECRIPGWACNSQMCVDRST